MEQKYRVGNFIYQLRTEKGLTQKELGERLGVTNKAVSKWENGSAVPRVQLLPSLAEALGCTQEELFLGGRKERSEETVRQNVYAEYLSVVERCDHCQHEVKRLFKKKLTCTKCGAELELTPRSHFLANLVYGLLMISLLLAGVFLGLELTGGIFAGGFPTPEEAEMHRLLLEHFPNITIIARIAYYAIITLIVLIGEVFWRFLIEKQVTKRCSFRIIRYPHAEDGKIVF